jgi:formylglycine-generating enzyme required for sulfatase activity
MDFVAIGNPNNVPDATGVPNPAGSVPYTYNIGKYEVSREMIDKANAMTGMGITMFDLTQYGGYNSPSQPAIGVTWYQAAAFVNFLNVSQGYQAAYNFSGGTGFKNWSVNDTGYNPNNKYRNSLARYFLPSADEWYKSAYFSPSTETYSNYANGKDTPPSSVAHGTDNDTAVYGNNLIPAGIKDAGGLSPYGTMAQNGNAWEWNETALDGVNDQAGEYRIVRGGVWNNDNQPMDSSFSLSTTSIYPDYGSGISTIGFRVASVPEPSSLSLLALGGVVVALRRRKKW